MAYRKTEETDLCWSATVETGVLFIGRGVAYHKTGLHMILFISTVDLLQPPPATVHPWAPVQPASTAPPLITIQPVLSTGSCSTTPPRATVHPALHRLDRSGYCSSSGNGLYYHGVLFIQPPAGTVHPNPLNNAHCSSREGGSSGRSALVSSSSEGITRVQLTARDRWGFSNVASAIARVQLEPNASLGFR